MSDLSQLYQEVILDHNKKPRNFHRLQEANRKAEGYNPLCGDKFTVYLKLEEGIVKDISFEGSGCAISTASASMMTTSLKGKTVREAEIIFERFHRMLTGQRDPADQTALGKLAVFSGVCEFPVRVKCATLAWHTLHAALEGKGEPVSTE
jgi:nitrogen fixation NifU-like protein